MNIHSFIRKSGLVFLLCILCVASISCKSDPINHKLIDLDIFAVTDERVDVEISGLVKSRIHDDVFWMHGDSGDEAIIFPVLKNGEIVSDDFENGIELNGIDNEDWEDIATDHSGNLFVGDIGNNCFCRQDLMVLQFPEPDFDASVVELIRKFRFVYPARLAAESQNSIPDAEALFFRNGNLYILTKESNGEDTGIYEMNAPDPSIINELQLRQTINFEDKVTAADISSSGDSIAILTSSSVWLLSDFSDNDFFSGTIKRVFFNATQVESIAFTGEESLLIAEETGELYEIGLSEFN